MHVSLNDAIDRATVIVSGGPVNADDAFEDKPGPAVIAFTVAHCWKGDYKPGDTVYCVDWNPRSSASLFFGRGASHLLFLKPLDPQHAGIAALGADLKDRFDVVELKSVEQMKDDPSDPKRSQRIEREQRDFDAACRVLQIRLVQKPEDLLAEWRKILTDDTNPALLQYAAEQLPTPLSEEDAAKVGGAILRVPADRYAVYRMLQLLGGSKYTFTPEQLRTLIERRAPLSSLLSQINAQNIAAIQEPLWARLTTPSDEDYADTDVLARLGKLAPDFAKEKLGKQLPFEIELPLLRAMGTNGQAFGRADYPRPMLDANAALTRRIGKAIRDSSAPFSLDFDMLRLFDKDGYRDDWFAIAPLMAPLLTAPDPVRRQQVAAFLRTLGYTVIRAEDAYRLENAPARVSMRLTVVKPDQPIHVGSAFSLHYRRTGVGGTTWVAREASTERWQIQRIDAKHVGPSEVRSSRSGWTWHETKPDAFVSLDADQSVDRPYSFDASFIQHPGRYRITLTIVQQDDGRGADVDAWTGALQAEPIEIDVIP